MSLEIVLVCENPQAHSGLVERLELAGLRVLARTALERALPLLNDPGLSIATIVFDSPRRFDPGLLAKLSLRHPELPQLVFDSGSASPSDLLTGDGGAGEGAKASRWLRLFRQPLTDTDSFPLIQQAIDSAREERIGSAPADLSGAPEKISMPVDVARDGRRASKKTPFDSEEFLRRVGAANVPVLLHGETGVGKEVMARRLWSYSSRSGKPFLKLNCAALPSELIESELFGYEKGAFTGATMDKPGKFELAQNGTVLLDEIGDMDIRLQAKLLQVLQDGEVQPLGSSRIVSVNVRVMAATHRDLRSAIEQGSFREDLYYRLNVISITIPPLRERRHEILSLATLLLLRHLSEGADPPPITESLQRAMLAYPWPGNVRELENVMRRFLVYRDAGLLADELEELTESFPSAHPRPRAANLTHSPANPTSHDDSSRGGSSGGGSRIDRLAQASREAESKLLLETLDAVRWNRRQAAAQLGIDYKAFLYKLQKHGIVESKAKRKDVGA